uniref:Ovule protein n=1 Tax=Ascaris lumbricoides TaxID=6252 RepID=A0A0M3HI26_ASCLU
LKIKRANSSLTRSTLRFLILPTNTFRFDSSSFLCRHRGLDKMDTSLIVSNECETCISNNSKHGSPSILNLFAHLQYR